MGGNIVPTAYNTCLDIPTSPQMIDAYAEKLTSVMHMEDIEKVVNAFNEQDELLNKAREYGELRARYSALEAATYIRIAKKGWSKALGSPNKLIRLAAEWLAKHNSEYSSCINAILHDGMTLVTYYKQRSKTELKTSTIKRYREQRGSVLKKYDDTGYINISLFPYIDNELDIERLRKEEVILDEYLERNQQECGGAYECVDTDSSCEVMNNAALRGYERKKTEEELREAGELCVNDLRIQLRKRGAVGIGNGVYVDPNAYSDLIPEAIAIRRKNVTACILRLQELCSQSGMYDFETELLTAIRKTRLSISFLN